MIRIRPRDWGPLPIQGTVSTVHLPRPHGSTGGIDGREHNIDVGGVDTNGRWVRWMGPTVEGNLPQGRAWGCSAHGQGNQGWIIGALVHHGQHQVLCAVKVDVGQQRLSHRSVSALRGRKMWRGGTEAVISIGPGPQAFVAVTRSNPPGCVALQLWRPCLNIEAAVGVLADDDFHVTVAVDVGHHRCCTHRF